MPDIMPHQASRFGEVAAMIRGGQPATAFTKAAEVCLENFEAFSRQMQPYAVLKLAIELHKHALFCEVSQDKARTAHDEEAYDRFQQYLSGNTDMPVALGLPNAGHGLGTDVDEDPDGSVEDDDGTRQ